MAKIKSVYICSECGYESPKWYGKCPSCGEWNTMNEEIKDTSKVSTAAARSHATAYAPPVHISEISTTDEIRYQTGSKELDRVMGGGIVKGSLILLGGDPGIGKSTILLQICEHLGRNLKILYVSGEESKRQLKLRADRLGVNSDNLYILTQTDVELVCETIRQDKPDIVMIDSIQTMSLSELNSSPGSVTQVRESTNFFMRAAKSLDIPMIIVGHVNKEGSIAGPKVLEHVVDAVLHFEGDRQMSYRILRAVKNRYGSTNEIGVFEMTDSGLREVENPSLMLISGRPKNVSGTCIACAMEGTRPILAEIQALAASTGFGNPRRMCTGFDYNRMNLIIAVLEKRAGYYFNNTDAYVNVVGGLRLDETAVDLAVAISLISSLKDVPINDNAIAFGEIGLAGEIRSVSHAQQRLNEAVRLGFEKIIIPAHNSKDITIPDGVEVIPVKNVRQAFEAICE
ncbi:DNA repair protein RadA [uncultured Ruminococcus sp.]|uniref:DNA repair protein RadA n=1 Tax=uncultured Ruminococcus sp. TaxID=165186 RepID=UPI00292D9DF6|nr:DNA repair protein RadA [uncultured Ruminococcus sp.]